MTKFLPHLVSHFVKNETKAKWGTLLSCSLSCFIAWLDFAIVNSALPAIEKSLSTSLAQLQWIMSAFILAVGVLIVILGRLSDHIGRRKMNIYGVARNLNQRL